MNKKLWAALAAVMATALVGCNNGGHTHTYANEWTTDDTHHWKSATCEHTTEVSEKAEHSYGEDGKCTVCQANKPVVTTVTQEEWTAAFEALASMNVNCSVNMSVVYADENESTNLHYVWYENIFYMEQTVGSDSMKAYITFDDAALKATMYSFENNAWSVHNGTSATENSFNAQKLGYSPFEMVFGFDGLSTEATGEGVTVDKLYSAFAHNDGVYSANLYDVGEGQVLYTLGFENGKLVSWNASTSAYNGVCTISYEGSELVIPQEALNAAAQN